MDEVIEFTKKVKKIVKKGFIESMNISSINKTIFSRSLLSFYILNVRFLSFHKNGFFLAFPAFQESMFLQSNCKDKSSAKTLNLYRLEIEP